MKHLEQKLKKESGATMIEAMLVLPILFSTVFFIVWYSRTMHQTNMMNEAMYRAGKIASTVPNIDNDLTIQGLDANGDADGDGVVSREEKEFRRTWKANALVEEAGHSFLSNVGILTSHKFKQLSKDIQKKLPNGDKVGGIRKVVGEVLALLPGECASYQGLDKQGQEVEKLTCNNRIIDRSFSDDQAIEGQIQFPLNKPSVLLKTYPIKILAIADNKGAKSILNWGEQEKEYNFFVIREPIPKGPFSQAIETALLNGEVEVGGGDEGVLTYGLPPDEVGPVKFCPNGVRDLVFKSSIDTKCPNCRTYYIDKDNLSSCTASINP